MMTHTTGHHDYFHATLNATFSLHVNFIKKKKGIWILNRPEGPFQGPEGPSKALRASIKFPLNLSPSLIGHITQSSQPSRRLGSEVSRVSVNPRGHVEKSSTYGGVRYNKVLYIHIQILYCLLETSTEKSLYFQ